MTPRSILLALDGSRQSLCAAELAWHVAKKMKAKIVVQTVVDSAAIWQAIGQGQAGFIGSGPYLNVHEGACKGLREAAEALHLAYRSRKEADEIETEYFIDEGDTLHEILLRARNCELVIIGHRYHQKDEERSERRFTSLSLTEQLSRVSPVPVLVVNERCEPWSAMRLIVCRETYNKATLEQFIDFSATMKASREVVCVGAAVGLDDLINQVRDDLPTGVRARLSARILTNPDDVGEFVIDTPPQMLPVMATAESAGIRLSCEGGKPDRFVHYSSVPCVMVLPAVPAAAKQDERPASFAVPI